MRRWRAGGDRGATLLELLFAVAVMATAAALSVPLVGTTVDDVRTGLAARYIAARVCTARMDAVRRSTANALRFEPAGEDYMFAGYADGNGNGVRSSDIRQGIDPVLAPFERLRDRFPNVKFELMAGVPDAEGQAGTGTDGVRIGTARILSMSSDGTATSGTLYIRGRQRQYAVRVLGVTGRTRVLQYSPGTRTWIDR
jgi:type II secretory pathway pseudopilin PulG